eukprot:9831466-Ditylum_brightwellii.AAC.1
MMHYEDDDAADDAVLAMCTNNDNTMLCTGSANGTIYIWKVQNGSGGNSSGTDAGGELLVVTGSGDGTVRVWDGRTSEVRRIIRPVSFAATVENTLSTA